MTNFKKVCRMKMQGSENTTVGRQGRPRGIELHTKTALSSLSGWRERCRECRDDMLNLFHLRSNGSGGSEVWGAEASRGRRNKQSWVPRLKYRGVSLKSFGFSRNHVGMTLFEVPRWDAGDALYREDRAGLSTSGAACSAATAREISSNTQEIGAGEQSTLKLRWAKGWKRFSWKTEPQAKSKKTWNLRIFRLYYHH